MVEQVLVYKKDNQPIDFKKQLQSLESQGVDKLFTLFQIGLPTGYHMEVLGVTTPKTSLSAIPALYKAN